MEIDLILREFRRNLTKEWAALEKDCDAWDDYCEKCFEKIVAEPLGLELPKGLRGEMYAAYGNNADTGILVKVKKSTIGLTGKKNNEAIWEWSECVAENEIIFTLIEFAHPSCEADFEHVTGHASENNKLFCFPVNECRFNLAT